MSPFKNPMPPCRNPAFLSIFELEYQQEGRWVLGTKDKEILDAGAVSGFLECMT